MDEIKRLTFHQLNHIFFHETDKHGSLVPIYDQRTDWKSDEERIREPWLAAGLSPEQCDIKWKEFVEEDGERFRLAHLPPDELGPRIAAFRAKQLARRGPAW